MSLTPNAEVSNEFDSTTLISDMAILVAIFLLGFLAKMFPRKKRNGH